jgi:hypothetical protein
MDYRKLFLITYWCRGRDKSDFNVFTFMLDLLILSTGTILGGAYLIGWL